MKILRFALLLAFVSPFVHGQDVGSGAPNAAIQQQFLIAYYRNGFASLVSLPPLTDVRRLGTNGLVQEFGDAAKTTGVKLALVMPNSSAPVVEGTNAVVQMTAGLYAYFLQIGANTAGMPVTDSINCPAVQNTNTCQYQLFDKPYALFVFQNPVNNAGTTFATRDPFFTKWKALGGIGSLGPATSAEATVTSPATTTATVQYFDRGAIYSVTSGTNSGRTFGVRPPIYSVYSANNLDKGFLGLPTSDELVVANGRVRQNFEGGSIEYDPANQSTPPVLRTPVIAVVVTNPVNPVRLNLGETTTLKASLFDSNGASLTDRQILWTTSNGRVVSVAADGASVVVKAVGSGTATVSATSEGKTSTAITFIVTAPCCQIGEGAPTTTIAQAFQDAVTRGKIAVKLPAASSVVRSGAGYVQQLQSLDATGIVYLIAVGDRSSIGFIVTGALLSRYLELGGPGGTLGYPTSDATSGGRQSFENGTLAGNPPQLVTGDILAKWATLGYETGIAGSPTNVRASSLTFRATSVSSQPFQNAAFISVISGKTSKVWAVTGLILAKYASLGGPGGRLGAPTGDEFASNGRRRQDFEGGSIDYAQGDSAAQSTETSRQPIVSANPSAVLAGTTVRLAVGGFESGANVRVSMTGQPDFTVNVPTGAYVWENYVPQTASSSSITIRAVDAANSTKAAQATYSIRAQADVKLQLSAVRGNGQTGAPGALLPAPLVVALKDDAGNPVAGVAVKFTASPGAAIESAAPVTNDDGEASAMLRLPGPEGVALVTIEAAHQVATMNARAVRTALSNFPKLTGDQGSMVTAVAAMVRYYQSRGDASSSNGLADAAALNAYLKGLCTTDAQGSTVCDGFIQLGDGSESFVNLWRVSGFAGNSLSFQADTPDLRKVRDWVAQGAPVLIALNVVSAGAPAGSQFVVATGIDPNGTIVIFDPVFSRNTLAEYLSGFSSNGKVVAGTVTGIAALVPRAPSSGGFVIAANATIGVTSSAGACGISFGLALQSGTLAELHYCDGAASLYELDLTGPSYSGSFTTLDNPPARSDLGGGGTASFKAVRSGAAWSVAPLDVSITSGGVVNAASFTTSIAPGGLVTIFGAGFGSDAKAIQVDFGGVPATPVGVFPFQVNVQAPATLSPGSATVRVSSKAGTAQQDVQVVAVAPALFAFANGGAAAVNKDGSVNGGANPARRGEYMSVFGTGLGAVAPDGTLFRTRTPVTATIGGVPAPILFSGLAPGFPGLYQINLSLPSTLAPGLELPLTIQQGNVASNTVLVAIQ